MYKGNLKGVLELPIFFWVRHSLAALMTEAATLSVLNHTWVESSTGAQLAACWPLLWPPAGGTDGYQSSRGRPSWE